MDKEGLAGMDVVRPVDGEGVSPLSMVEKEGRRVVERVDGVDDRRARVVGVFSLSARIVRG